MRNIYFKGKTTTIESIVNLYYSVFMYQLLRIFVMLTIFTYFLACFWYLMSESQDLSEGESSWFITFVSDLEYVEIVDQLVVSLYYALTMLSTVGYGDLYPISNLEKIVGVFCMWIGVAVFSVIMEQFSECQEDFDSQMGDPNRKEFFDSWLLLL